MCTFGDEWCQLEFLMVSVCFIWQSAESLARRFARRKESGIVACHAMHGMLGGVLEHVIRFHDALLLRPLALKPDVRDKIRSCVGN